MKQHENNCALLLFNMCKIDLIEKIYGVHSTPDGARVIVKSTDENDSNAYIVSIKAVKNEGLTNGKND